MAKSYKVIGDSAVAGKLKGEQVSKEALEELHANIPALIEGGHIEDPAGGDSAPASPAQNVQDAPKEG